MTDRELKKLSRADILELLLEERRQNQLLRAQIKEFEDKLNDKSIIIEEAGSIAQAAIGLNGVLEAAEKAAAQYLENVKRLSSEKEAECRQLEAEARERADAVIKEAQDYSRRVHAETDKYQSLLIEKLKAVLKAHDDPGFLAGSGGEERRA